MFCPIIRQTNKNPRISTRLWCKSYHPIDKPSCAICQATKQGDPTTLGSIFKVNQSNPQLVISILQAAMNWMHYPFYTRLLGPIKEAKENLTLLATALTQGLLHICCDGAHNPLCKVSSHGWVVKDSESSVF